MPVGGYSGSDFYDLIERVYRRVQGNQRESVFQVTDAVGYNDTELAVGGLGATGLHAGGILAIETEVCLVLAASVSPTALTGVVDVERGYQGSPQAEHAAGTVCYNDPRFTRWDVAVAINDALAYLSAPSFGLFQVITQNITYNPVLKGYDLSAFPPDFIRLVELTYDVPDASHNFPPIRHYRIRRGIKSSKIPSGRALIIYDAGWPGLNMNIAAACPFSPLINFTDDVEAVAGLNAQAIDVLGMSAEIDLTIVQEIKRGQLGSQTDPQKLQNVPPGTTSQAVQALKMIRDERAAQEAGRLAQLWPEIPQGY